jgi:hypothetical protein
MQVSFAEAALADIESIRALSVVIPAKERVKEFGIERFLILRQAQDEEMDGILPLILSPVEGCGPRFDVATDSLTCSFVGMTTLELIPLFPDKRSAEELAVLQEA